MNIEKISAILPDQKANVERIEDRREEVDQGNNQAEVIEPAEEIEHTLEQEEYFSDLLTEVGYIPDQDDGLEEVEESQEEENSSSLASPPKNFMVTLLRRKKTTT